MKTGSFCMHVLHCLTTQGTVKVPQGSQCAPQPSCVPGGTESFSNLWHWLSQSYVVGVIPRIVPWWPDSISNKALLVCFNAMSKTFVGVLAWHREALWKVEWQARRGRSTAIRLPICAFAISDRLISCNQQATESAEEMKALATWIGDCPQT